MHAPCRLPFTDFTQTGFISYPDGNFIPDPSAALVPDPARPNISATQASPTLYGTGGSGGETYDWARSRWLPIGRELVSPSGSQYTYTELIPNPASQGIGGPPPLGTRVHLVDAASGTDTVVYTTTAVFTALAFRSEGIYLTQPASLSDTVNAFYLWLLDLTSRSARQLMAGKSAGPAVFDVIADGALWMTATDQTNPKGPVKLLRIALGDGSQSVWFEQSTTFAAFLGLDLQNHPVIATFSGDNDAGQTVLMPSPNTFRPIADEGFQTMVADSGGLWFTGSGVFLYVAGGPPQKISPKVGGWLLGDCR